LRYPAGFAANGVLVGVVDAADEGEDGFPLEPPSDFAPAITFGEQEADFTDDGGGILEDDLLVVEDAVDEAAGVDDSVVVAFAGGFAVDVTVLLDTSAALAVE